MEQSFQTNLNFARAVEEGLDPDIYDTWQERRPQLARRLTMSDRLPVSLDPPVYFNKLYQQRDALAAENNGRLGPGDRT